MLLLSKKIWISSAVLLLGLAALFYPSCSSEYVDTGVPVCFESEVLPIFQSNCTQSGCHNAIEHADGYDLTNYDGIVRKGITPGNYRKSELYTVCVPPFNSMPEAPYAHLSDAQLTTIALWIEQGAENTTNCTSTACDTTNVTYAATIAPIFATYCTGCHGGSIPEAGIDLSSWEGAQSYALDGSILGSIEHNSNYSAMPKNANKLSECNINKVRQWIANGALDN